MDLTRKSTATRRRRLRRTDRSSIAVIGTGYVGLVAGVCFANMGHSVICVDISPERVASLARGEVPYYEPGLQPRLVEAVRRGNVGFTTDVGLAARETSTLFITVGTPSALDGSSDTSAIFAIARQVAVSANGPRTLVIKSTAPVGTAAAVQADVDQIRPGLIKVLVNPEFLREGSAVKDFVEPKRIVIGADDPHDAAPLLAIYRQLPTEAPRMANTRRMRFLLPGSRSSTRFPTSARPWVPTFIRFAISPDWTLESGRPTCILVSGTVEVAFPRTSAQSRPWPASNKCRSSFYPRYRV